MYASARNGKGFVWRKGEQGVLTIHDKQPGWRGSAHPRWGL